MKAIFLKELRENARWALLMMLGLGALMLYAISHNSNPPLVSLEMHSVTAFGFAAAGFILGILQILQDHWRGRWAFVSHRPISRSRIFLGKLFAGVALYLPIAGIPLAFATIWAATPGHVAAPFDWRMILPRLADLFGGLVWHQAGLLVAGRNARWIGSRLLPAGLAFFASIFGGTFSGILGGDLSLNLASVILIYAAAMLFLLPGAWGALVSGGEYENEPLIARGLQAVSVGTGVLIVYVMAITIAGNLLDPFFSTQRDYTFRDYVITDDGRALFATYNSAGNIASAVDLQGRQLSAEESTHLQKHQLAETSVGLAGLDPEFGTLQSEWAYDVPLAQEFGMPVWYYVKSRQSIEGYDPKTCRYVGCIGPDGFVAADSAPASFPEPLMIFSEFQRRPVPILTSAHSVYTLDISARQVQKIFQAGPGDQIENASEVAIDDNGNRKVIFYAIVTHSTAYIVKNDAVAMSVALDHNFPDFNNVQIGQAADGRYILYYPQINTDQKKHVPGWVEHVDDRGLIVQRTELPPLPVEPPQPSPKWAMIGFGTLMPPSVMAANLFENGPGNDPDFKIAEIGMIIAAIASAAIALLLMRRYDSAPSAKVVWLAVGALFGIMGILLLLCMRQAVAREACPSCSKHRLVTREKCEHCGRVFAEPQRLGIEVLQMA